jgi:cysteine desulfurase
MQFAYAYEEKRQTLLENSEKLLSYREKLWDLLDKDIYTRLSPLDGTPYILTLSAVGLRGEILLHMARDKGLLIGTGSACSSNSKMRYNKVILACGYDEKTADGGIRLSFSTDTTEEEIISSANILNEIGRDLKRRMG